MASDSLELAQLAGRFALDKRATDVVILDLRGLTSVTDYFVICSGAADIHTKAIAEYISDSLSKEDHKPWHIEGLNYGSWILMDYVDVVVHIFLTDKREYYGLERLWGDAPGERLED